MKLNKIFLLAGLAVMGLMAASCSSDNDYTPGKPAGSNNVVFINQANQVLPLTATDFNVELRRDSSAMASELTVPLDVIQCPSVLSCPNSVTFASGKAVTTLTVSVSDQAEAYEEYILRVRIPEEYTNSYIYQKSGAPQLNITVLKEDYKVVQKGTYLSWWTEKEEDAELEYSEFLDSYRFNKQTSGKFTFAFTLGEVVTDEEDELAGMQPITFEKSFSSVGCVTSADWAHSDYGAVTMRGYNNQPSYYDPSTKTYYFDIRWLVAAGSFGDYYDTFTVK